ncbi:hypothetical protein F441_05794, partial [Phytophthora nicotianae CJ01A1]
AQPDKTTLSRSALCCHLDQHTPRQYALLSHTALRRSFGFISIGRRQSAGSGTSIDSCCVTATAMLFVWIFFGGDHKAKPFSPFRARKTGVLTCFQDGHRAWLVGKHLDPVISSAGTRIRIRQIHSK